MPRSRNIKYETFMDDEFGELEPIERLFYIASTTIADFNGNFIWRVARLKAELMPYDNIDLQVLAINLDRSRFYRFYSDGEKLYCNIAHFGKNQNPHKNEREKGTNIPNYSNEMRELVDLEGLTINPDKSRQYLDENGSPPADSCILYPDSGSLKPDSLSAASSAVQTFKIPENLPEELLDIGFQAIAKISPVAYDIEFPLEWDRFRTHKSSTDIPDCTGLANAWLKWMTHPATCERLSIK